MLKKTHPELNKRSSHYRKQSPFKGSNREIRGKILKILTSESEILESTLSKKLQLKLDKIRSILQQLEQEGFVVEIFEAVQALTKQPGEDYMNYIQRTAVTNLSLTVKMADLKDNMDLTRCKQLKPADLKRMEKYLKARQYLQKVLTETNQ